MKIRNIKVILAFLLMSILFLGCNSDVSTQTKDNTAPVITLIGNSEISVKQDETYTDAGAKATDDTNEDITTNIIVNNPVNTAILGRYIVTYNVNDAASNKATQVTRTVTVIENTSDTQAPSTPTNLTATVNSSTQINLSWTASTDNVGITGYKIYRDDSEIATTVNTSYLDTELTVETTYSYRVSAYDVGENNSNQSLQVQATTQVQSTGSYVPPIGIPAPEFGINETVESVYGSADYYTYYVDNTHPNATDSGNSNGSPNTPRMSIPRYLTAGDVVQIHGGPYSSTSGGRFYFNGQGTPTQPIFITGANALTKPVLKDFVHLPDAQYMIFENMKMQTDAYGVDIRPLSNGVEIHHVSIRNSEIAGNGTFKSGQSFAVSNSYYDMPISYIVFYNNLSYDSGQWDSVAEDDSPSFAVQINVNHIWVLDNIGYRSGGDGVILAHNADFTTHHIYIGRNTFYDHRENGLDLKEANDVIVSQNKLYNFSATNSSAGSAIVIHYNPQRIWILYNEIYNADRGITTTGSTETWFIGNIIRDIRHPAGSLWDPTNGYSAGAAMHFRGASSGGAIGNTLYNYDTGIQLTQGSGFDVYNNIFDSRIEAEGMDVIVANSTIASNSSINNNIFNNSQGEARIYWSAGPYNITDFKSSVGKCLLCLEADPIFNLSTNNFTLQSTSPARNTGIISSAYDTFYNLYGIDIKVDFNGNSRPQGSTWDIGAYEYVDE
jgi:hypothetical protein